MNGGWKCAWGGMNELVSPCCLVCYYLSDSG